jgi:hypothetical protein
MSIDSTMFEPDDDWGFPLAGPSAELFPTKYMDISTVENTFDEWMTCSSCVQIVCVCAPATTYGTNTILEEYDLLNSGTINEDWDKVTRFLNEDIAGDVGIPSQASNMMGQARPKSSRKSTKGKTFKHSKPTKAKFKRTIISNAMRTILDDHFLIDPYPNAQTISQIRRKTDLTERTIQIWFANARSRKQRVERTCSSASPK